MSASQRSSSERIGFINCRAPASIHRGSYALAALLPCSMANVLQESATKLFRRQAAAACPFGMPCRGATLATSHRGEDVSHLEAVIPKNGAFLPGNTTVTWHRLLQDWTVLQECSLHMPALSDILEHVDAVSCSMHAASVSRCLRRWRPQQ